LIISMQAQQFTRGFLRRVFATLLETRVSAVRDAIHHILLLLRDTRHTLDETTVGVT
jgi:hypothetical protein